MVDENARLRAENARLRALIIRIENEAHDGGILAETMAQVHIEATQ